MTREEAEMKPCPFCGSTDMMKRIGKGFRWNRVRCNGCKAFGPLAMYDNPDELWNIRAALAPPAASEPLDDEHPITVIRGLQTCLAGRDAELERLRIWIEEKRSGATLPPNTIDAAIEIAMGRERQLNERDAEIDRLRSELSALQEGVRKEAGPALLYLRQVRHITTGGDLWRFVCDGDRLADVTDRLAALVEGK